MGPKFKDITGNRYERLLVIKYCGKNKNHQTLWECKCDCGNNVIKFKNQLTSGHTKSCGCLQREYQQSGNIKHGMTRTPEYDAYHEMLKRCYNKNRQKYKNYGARGIKVCDRWLESFDNFYKDMGDRPGKNYLLDRIDPNGNYEPENCRWVTSKESSRNKRTTIFVTFNGKTKCLADWAEILNMKYLTLYNRIQLYGWSAEKAFTTSSKMGGK